MIVGVLVELSSKNIDKEFFYSVPIELKENIKIGIRVEVPFGPQKLEGFVTKIKSKTDENIKDIKFKDILNIVDKDIVLNKELLLLGKIMQDKTLSTLISCYQVMLPKALKAKKGVVVAKKYDIFYKLEEKNITGKINESQAKILNLFKKSSVISKKEIEKISSSSLKTLEHKNILIKIEKEHYRLEYEKLNEKKYILTEEQQQAVKEIENTLYHTYLLHGVTGSGKTEVYMELIDNVLKKGKTAIVLVPEISLTPQMIKRFTEKFGMNIAVLHSALSDGEKYDEWRRIQREEVQIVIGARSALFAPLKNLGLIIIDEEHSDTYKQDDSNPKYSAIEMSIERCKLNKDCKVILGSATPSLDSFAKAKKNIYHLVSLKNRVNKKPLPTIELIDMNKEIRNSRGHFSNKLLEKIKEKVQKKEQVILLLNRRGYSSFISCKNCGYVFKCPHCDITLTYHKTTNNLRCHYCGYAENKTDKCPDCKEKSISSLGVGTEKIEEELMSIYKDIKISRMDFDTTSKKGAHAKIIKEFREHKQDILLGTQIVAKGLDFENVTLVGVINADTSLNIPDFKSCETTFSLLSQVAGRSGRSNKEGEVLIQTFNKEHYTIQYVKNHDYIGFYNEEMKIRQKLKYPPFYYMVYIRISSKDNDIGYKESIRIKKSLEKYLDKTIILGPSASSLFKLNNIYRYGITLKYKKQENLVEVLNKMIDAYKGNHKITIDINLNPGHL